ncbi:MAG: N-acetyltransferase [Campylobacteraceae bacterium]|jgi:UDP-2-acetamido-3-amino-2,3-dideoxy-glucuronate N-acetyltransferase|nr:N-acetyltransferase [Campylobacteraceae bacterium]
MSFFVHESSYVDDNVEIGEGTKIWHFCHVISGTKIGKNCSFGQNCVIGPNAVIGSGVKVQNNVSLYDGVVIEDDVFVGPSVVFTNVTNPRSFIVRKEEYKKTVVKKGASLGANCTVVCGTTIGEYAFVGAGSTVTKDVPAFALVYGNPARIKGWYSKAGYKLTFDADGIAVDESDSSRYRLADGKVTLI